MKLSQLAKDICKANYKNNCERCHIRPACVDHVAIRSQQDLDQHTCRVNKLAEEVSL